MAESMYTITTAELRFVIRSSWVSVSALKVQYLIYYEYDKGFHSFITLFNALCSRVKFNQSIRTWIMPCLVSSKLIHYKQLF